MAFLARELNTFVDSLNQKQKKERIDARAIRAFSSFYSFCFVSVSLNETEKKQVERWKR